MTARPSPTAKIPKLGDEASDFTLPDEHGTPISLSSLQPEHHVVLIFYPGDLTPGCTMQLCAIRDDWSKFAKSGCLVFGINHGSPQSHRSFSQKFGFPFPLLIDAEKRVSALYGAVASRFGFSVIRRTVVGINPKGKIVYYRHGMPKNTEILKACSSHS